MCDTEDMLNCHTKDHGETPVALPPTLMVTLIFMGHAGSFFSHLPVTIERESVRKAVEIQSAAARRKSEGSRILRVFTLRIYK